MKKTIRGFTFVELVVAISIVVLLSSMGLISYTSYISNARDGERVSNIAMLKSNLKLYKQKRGFYPKPGGSINLLHDGAIVANQGFMDENVSLSTSDNLPVDPFVTTKHFSYSITKNKQEYQVAATLENKAGNKFISVLDGDYKTVSKNILPTLILAVDSLSDLEIKDGVGDGPENRKKFIFNMSSNNLPYTFQDPFSPYNSGADFNTLINDTEIEFWQNSDYISCDEIYEAGKSIGNGEYQILTDSGLVNTNCTF